MSDQTDRRTYYFRTVSMYMELTKDILLRLFKHLIKSENITQFLTDVDIIGKLRDLFKDDILNKSEFNLVSSSWPDPEKFDIALLIRLIVGLCRDRITQPQHGWEKKLQPKDESLGADLLRLRDVRNKLIGHRPYATLEKEEYNTIWDKMEEILSRVVAAFDMNEVETLKKKMKMYEDLHFETENRKIKRYLDELEISNQETKALQCRVEELLKKSKEFKTYFKTTPERYVRYIKLLFDGGKIVLGGVLERELRDQNRTLVSLISENRDMLSCRIENEYHLFLFPQQNEEIDYKCWEVGLLASVILLLLTNLSLDDISAIENILTARQDYAKHAVSSLDADEFLDIWTDLIKSLTQLSMGIEKEKKNDVETLIIRFKKKSSELDADLYLHQLRASGVPVKTLKGVYDETMYQLKQKLRRLKESGIPFQCKHLFEVKITVSCEDEEKKKSAEDCLERNLKASLNNANDHDNFLKMETDMFMASITSHPGVEPVGIKRGCILLSFQCSTLDGVLYFLDYLHGQHFQERITNISDELSYLFEEPFLLQGYITLESLLNTPTQGCRENYLGEGISIPLESSSMEGIELFLDSMHSDKTSNILNSITDKISEKLNETVSIYVSADLHEFTDALDGTVKITEGLQLRGHIKDDKVLVTPSTTDLEVSDPITEYLREVKNFSRSLSSAPQVDVINSTTDKETVRRRSWPHIDDETTDQESHLLEFDSDFSRMELQRSQITEESKPSFRNWFLPMRAPAIQTDVINSTKNKKKSRRHGLLHRYDERTYQESQFLKFDSDFSRMELQRFHRTGENKAALEDLGIFEGPVKEKTLSQTLQYQERKQELKDYLISRYKKGILKGMFGYFPSRIIGFIPPYQLCRYCNIRSSSTEYITSDKDIFYGNGRLQKKIYIIGHEKYTSAICKNIISTWCGAELIRIKQCLPDFDFVFMLSLTVVGSEVSVYNMIQKQFPSEEYATTLRQVLHHEPEKCLVILDGLDRWKRNVNKSGDDFETPDRTLFKDSVVIMTADYRLRNFIEKTFPGDHLLYTD